MNLETLTQYCDLREEIKDLCSRIVKDERSLTKIEEEGKVSDTVTGTREDGTIGPIKITGFPVPEYETKKAMLKKRIAKLHILEEELQEALNQVDDFVNAIPKSEIRMLFRLYYLDDYNWIQVARIMNKKFPKRKYTEDGCRMKHNRYLEKVEKN